MDDHLIPGVNYGAEGGLISISTTDPFAYREFRLFLAEAQNPHPLSLVIPERPFLRGKSKYLNMLQLLHLIHLIQPYSYFPFLRAPLLNSGWQQQSGRWTKAIVDIGIPTCRRTTSDVRSPACPSITETFLKNTAQIVYAMSIIKTPL